MADEESRWRARWLEVAQLWERRVAGAGLSGVAHAIGEAVRPLTPLATQLLWFVQPAFALFGQSEMVGALAELVEEPGAFRQPDRMEQPESK